MTTDTPEIQARRLWAQKLIARGPGCPAYGTEAWLALPEASPEKVAAVVIAAEASARELDNLEADLQVEIEAMREAHKLLDDLDYQARRDAHKAEWQHLPELHRRHVQAQRAYAERYGSGSSDAA